MDSSEPQPGADSSRAARGRPAPVKKTLSEFLVEFDERLQDYSAHVPEDSALRARAEGRWRTPVEGRPARVASEAAAAAPETGVAPVAEPLAEQAAAAQSRAEPVVAAPTEPEATADAMAEVALEAESVDRDGTDDPEPGDAGTEAAETTPGSRRARARRRKHRRRQH